MKTDDDYDEKKGKNLIAINLIFLLFLSSHEAEAEHKAEIISVNCIGKLRRNFRLKVGANEI